MTTIAVTLLALGLALLSIAIIGINRRVRRLERRPVAKGRIVELWNDNDPPPPPPAERPVKPEYRGY